MVYRERKRGGTKIARSTVIEGPSMIGSGCSIGELCLIQVRGIDLWIIYHDAEPIDRTHTPLLIMSAFYTPTSVQYSVEIVMSTIMFLSKIHTFGVM